MPNCLIIGGDSVLGRGLARVLRQRGHGVSLTTRRADAADRSFLDLETLEGLALLDEVSESDPMRRSYLFEAARADALRRLGDASGARESGAPAVTTLNCRRPSTSMSA